MEGNKRGREISEDMTDCELVEEGRLMKNTSVAKIERAIRTENTREDPPISYRYPPNRGPAKEPISPAIQ